MFILLAALCFTSNIITGSSFVNNELVRNIKLKYDLGKWHDHDVADGEYPFVVSLALIEKQIVTRHCSGSMITPVWVLSSSHCYYDLPHKKFFVWYGNYTISPLKTLLYTKIQKIFIHPKFKMTEFTRPGYFFGDNDISLLRTLTSVDVQKYGRLSSIDHSKMYGLSVTYVGGVAKNKERGVDQFKPLQAAEGVVIQCGMTLTMWSKYVACVFPKCSDKSHQPMHGDTGGPFIYEGKIIGVMSLSFQIPKSNIFTNGLTPISPYKDWIRHVMHARENILS